jgi:hypothetical protein
LTDRQNTDFRSSLEHIIAVGSKVRRDAWRRQEFQERQSKQQPQQDDDDGLKEGTLLFAEDIRIYGGTRSDYEIGFAKPPWPIPIPANGYCKPPNNSDGQWDIEHGDSIHPIAFSMARLAQLPPKDNDQIKMDGNNLSIGTTDISLQRSEVPRALLLKCWERAVHAASCTMYAPVHAPQEKNTIGSFGRVNDVESDDPAQPQATTDAESHLPVPPLVAATTNANGDTTGGDSSMPPPDTATTDSLPIPPLVVATTNANGNTAGGDSSMPPPDTATTDSLPILASLADDKSEAQTSTRPPPSAYSTVATTITTPATNAETDSTIQPNPTTTANKPAAANDVAAETIIPTPTPNLTTTTSPPASTTTYQSAYHDAHEATSKDREATVAKCQSLGIDLAKYKCPKICHKHTTSKCPRNPCPRCSKTHNVPRSLMRHYYGGGLGEPRGCCWYWIAPHQCAVVDQFLQHHVQTQVDVLLGTIFTKAKENIPEEPNAKRLRKMNWYDTLQFLERTVDSSTSCQNATQTDQTKSHPVLDTLQTKPDASPLVLNPMVLNVVKHRLIDRYADVPR